MSRFKKEPAPVTGWRGNNEAQDKLMDTKPKPLPKALHGRDTDYRGQRGNSELS